LRGWKDEWFDIALKEEEWLLEITGDVSLCHIWHQVERTFMEVGGDGMENEKREPCLASDVLSIWDACLGERKVVEETCVAPTAIGVVGLESGGEQQWIVAGRGLDFQCSA